MDPSATALQQVVAQHEAPVVVGAAHQLLELQADEPTVGAELDDGHLGLVRDPAHHLGSLQEADHVAHGDEVLHLQRRELRRRGVEALAVLLERLQRLVGPTEQQPRGQERSLLVAQVDGDRVPRLRHRHDGHAEGARHPFGGAVARAGLRGGDRGIGHQVHVGPGDATGVVGQDDGAVHLRQLRQALGREGGVEEEAARADPQHRGVVAHHDERAEPGLADPVQPFAQRLPRRDGGEGREHGQAGGGHPPMLVNALVVVGGRRTPSPSCRHPIARSDGALRRRRPPRPPRPRCAPPGPPDPVDRRGADAGTMAARNPRRTASARRRGRCGTCRTSPPRPTSPQTTTDGSSATPMDELTTAKPDGQVGCRLGQADAADHQREHVGGRQADPEPLLEHRQQQRHPTTVEALRRAATAHRPRSG